MRRINKSSAIILVGLIATLALAAPKPRYITADEVDYASILSGPPADNSREHKEEIATLLHWQNKRTSEDISRCKSEESADAFIFAEVLGDWFNSRSLPITAALLEQAATDASAISSQAKKNWNRPRPFQADPQIEPCVTRDSSPSYPSNHAVRGIVWATVLSQIFPDHRDQLMALGRRFGDDRVIAGVHWPSDVEAGQKLGAEIAAKLLDNPDFKSEMESAKVECMTPVPVQ